MSEQEKKWVTNADLALELRALRSDVKLWILAGVAFSKFLDAVELPSTVTAAAVVVVLGKSAVTFVLARFGGS